MRPTSYLFDQRDDCYRMYLGGLSTIDGLTLVPRDGVVTNFKLYCDGNSIHNDAEIDTVAAAIEYLKNLASHVDPVDCSCDINGGLSLSTHDDCECSFRSQTVDELKVLAVNATSMISNRSMWETLRTYAGHYVVFQKDGTFETYPDFDALVASQT